MTETPIKKPRVIYNTNNRLTNFLKEKEGFEPKPYLDPAGLPTIGYGTRYYEDGVEVTMDDEEIDEARATELLTTYMESTANELMNMPGFDKLNPNQKDAIVSFGYNFGQNFYKDKTNFGIISGAVEDNDLKAIKDAFGLYVNVADDEAEKGYSESPGLVERRKQEVIMFDEVYNITSPKPKSIYDNYVNTEETEEESLIIGR